MAATATLCHNNPFISEPPHRDRRIRHRPANSSPLSWNYPSSPESMSSSSASRQTERRRAQYKSQGGVRATPTRSPSSGRTLTGSLSSPSSGILSSTNFTFSTPRNPSSTPRKEGDLSPSSTILREKFKAKVLEKAVAERKKRLSESQRRLRDVQVDRRVELSSDGFDYDDVDMDEDEEDEGAIDDELVSRILSSVTRRETYSRYRYTYSRDVGSSDPAYEDPDQWEAELNADLARLDDLDAEEMDSDEELAAYAAAASRYDVEDVFDDDSIFDGLSAEELEAIGLGSTATMRRGDGMDMS